VGAPAATPTPTTTQPPVLHRATAADVEATSDRFGIDYLQPTLVDGTFWVSDWAGDRTFDGVDPRDPWFDADHGSATFAAGDGELRISGEIPRMYVHDPAMERQWRDVEVTMYFKRVADSGVPYAGMTAVARSNHLATEEGMLARCDTRGYGARMRYDGNVDFEKETAHPENDPTRPKVLWPDGMPQERWIGYKFLVYDRGPAVKLELWLDQTNGADGGLWIKVDELLDDGNTLGETPCAPGIDARVPLTNDPAREGSESGRPNVSVYFRGDGVGEDGLVYKWGSIREINVP
jgi:hypothetical protein